MRNPFSQGPRPLSAQDQRQIQLRFARLDAVLHGRVEVRDEEGDVGPDLAVEGPNAREDEDEDEDDDY